MIQSTNIYFDNPVIVMFWFDDWNIEYIFADRYC